MYLGTIVDDGKSNFLKLNASKGRTYEMKMYLVLTVITCAVCTADTVWTFPFTELGADWTNGYLWEIDATGGHFDEPLTSAVTDWWYSTLSSGIMTLPAGVDSITIEFMSGYDYSGGVMDGWSYISILAEADTGTGSYTIIDITDGVSSMGYATYSGSDTTLVTQPLPVSTGETLELKFTVGFDMGGDIYWADLYWVLWDMIIIGHSDTSLSSTTWAYIKRSF